MNIQHIKSKILFPLVKSELITCVAIWTLSGLIILSGSTLGSRLVGRMPIRGQVFDNGAGMSSVNWDGQWYKSVAKSGYFYDDRLPSNVAFFPAYPIFARIFSSIFFIDFDFSLILVSNISVLLSIILAYYYIDANHVDGKMDLAWNSVLAMILAPPTFFFRMAYSDSLFLLLIILFLLGTRRGWSLFVLAAIIGLSTATRAAGVALVPAFVYYIIKCKTDLMKAVLLVSFSMWGLLIFVFFLYIKFDEPFAFMKTQIHWNIHSDSSFFEKATAIIKFQPILDRVNFNSPYYWERYEHHNIWLFSLYLADPFYFLAAFGLIVFGAKRGWLSCEELIVAIGLFAMPLYFKCYESNMIGFGRYAATIFPVYIILGKIIQQFPVPIPYCIFALSGALMAIYTALFSSWYILL